MEVIGLVLAACQLGFQHVTRRFDIRRRPVEVRLPPSSPISPTHPPPAPPPTCPPSLAICLASGAVSGTWSTNDSLGRRNSNDSDMLLFSFFSFLFLGVGGGGGVLGGGGGVRAAPALAIRSCLGSLGILSLLFDI